MRSSSILLSALAALMPATASAADTIKLNVTAISARDGVSTLECWQMDRPLEIPTQSDLPGSIRGVLSNVSTVTYTVLPPKYDSPVHPAPTKLWVVVVGFSQVTVPGDDVGFYTSSDTSSLFFAADTADVSSTGHRSQNPGDAETISFQIPTQGAVVPPHSVVHMGPCGAKDFVGMREAAIGAMRSDPVEPRAAWTDNLFPFHL
ncbi:hypothetical protein GGR52DRAFT_568589 [Hypoxylon sp. FL1284]|nr:hypothetical protein GGR52DRAFT_568589 [Hypoxylon sp. FL1284]